MKVDAIIFDKDGTLIDFDAFWVAVSVKALQDVLKRVKREDVPVLTLLTALGVQDGVTDADSVLCKGTYKQIGEIVHNILKENGCDYDVAEVEKFVLDGYNQNAEAGEVQPTCPDLKETLMSLKNRNIKLAVVTTDNERITRTCLTKLGVMDLFDAIYTDDGKTPTKPHPFCALDFCRSFGVEKENAVMVGDTLTDVAFARNAGIAVIGLAKNEQNKSLLTSRADVVVEKISDILSVLD